MSARMVSGGDLTPEQRRVHRVEHILRRDGGSPGSALEGLAALVEDGTWRKVPSGPDDSRPFASFRHFVEAAPPFGLGYSIKQLRALLQLQHPGEGAAEIRERMDVMRAAVERLLVGATPVAATAGGDRRSVGFQDSATDLERPKRETRDHLVSRLKRLAPELARQVEDGELSANAAAQQAGIRKPRILVTSPESVARSLRRHMSPADLSRLVSLLAADDEQS